MHVHTIVRIITITPLHKSLFLRLWISFNRLFASSMAYKQIKLHVNKCTYDANDILTVSCILV